MNILTQPEYFMEHPIGFESSKISEPESDSEDFVPVCKPRARNCGASTGRVNPDVNYLIAIAVLTRNYRPVFYSAKTQLH